LFGDYRAHAATSLRPDSARLLRPERVLVTALITEEQRRALLHNGNAAASGAQADPWPVVKLFTPDAHATWLLVQLDPQDEDTACGLCDLGMGAPRLDHVRLSDLQSIRGPRNLRVLRDTHFVPKRPLSEYLRRAEADGSIND
jgi:hypothetical protein